MLQLVSVQHLFFDDFPEILLDDLGIMGVSRFQLR